jgi:PAS domain S-box-containing protein
MGKPWSGNGFNPMLIVAIANSCSLVVLAWVYSRLGLGFTHLPFSEDVLRQSKQPNPDGESVAEPLDSALQPGPEHSTQSQNAERFFNLSLDMLLISNTDGYVTHINPAWERILGLTIEELKAQPWINFVHPQDMEATQTQMEQLGRGVCITGFENRYRCKDGSYKWLSWTAVPFLEEGLIYAVARDVSDYKQAEEALRRVNQELEIAIAERLTQLMQTSQDLLTEIAERKQMEEALRSSEQRFRVALQNSPTFVFSQNSELRYTWIYNPNPETQLQRAIGQSDAEIMAAEDAKRLTAIKQRVLTTGVGTREEVFVTVKEEIRYYDLTVEPLLGSTGDVVGITCAATDITSIRIREQQLRAIFEQSLDAITITDNQGIYLEANPAACQLFGLPLSELLGRRIVEFMEPGFDFASAWRSFRQQGQLTGTMRLLHLDGTVRNVDYAAKADFLPGQHLSILRDITEREQVEIALLEERNFISAILEAVNALIAVLDDQGRFVRFNRACEQITGYSLEEVKGKYIWDLFLIPKEVEAVQAMIQELQAGQFPNESEHYWLARDGSRHLISWFNTVILDTDGSIKHIISIGIDITDRKRAEDMRRALEREQALSELRLRFFSMASHEFRTPLSTILLTAQILESSAQGWSQEKRTRNLQRIVSAAKEMRQMLDDILTINRAETGRLEFAPTPIELNAFCQQMLQEMRIYATALHTLVFSNPSEAEWALMDEKLLRYILSNLLSNAIKYSPQGGEINLEILRNQEAILLQIYDRGIGIPLSDQPHLFEAFHRGANVESIPGSGLGLTVAKKCVDLHGGRIMFTSEVGVGTTFTVMIPIQIGIKDEDWGRWY